MFSSFRIASLFVLLIVLVSAAQCAEVVVPFTGGEAEITDAGGGLVSVHVPGFSAFASPGDPALPFSESYVLLPPNADLRTVRVEIRNAVERKLHGRYSVQPTPPLVTEVDGKRIESWKGKEIENGRNMLIYDSNESYPSDYATLGCEGKLGPYLLIPVRFWPYRYNPVTGKLSHLVTADVALVFDTVASTASVETAQAGQAMMGRLRQMAARPVRVPRAIAKGQKTLTSQAARMCPRCV